MILELIFIIEMFWDYEILYVYIEICNMIFCKMLLKFLFYKILERFLDIRYCFEEWIYCILIFWR